MATRGFENVTAAEAQSWMRRPASTAAPRRATLPQGVTSRPRSQQGPDDWANVLYGQLQAMRLPLPVREAVLVPGRKFKTDLSWLDRLVFVECDGGEFSHGRHGRAGGMQSDCVKWNALTLAGWTGFRFVGSQVRSGYALQVLEQVLKS